MKTCIRLCLLTMLTMIAESATPLVDKKSSGGIVAAEDFVHQLPALWAHGTEGELFDITTNTVDAILSNKDEERRDLAFTYCADAVAALNVESRNDEDYDRSLDMRGYLIEMMLRYSGKTDAGILRGFDCRVKFYETLKRESVKFPVVKLPRFVEDLKAAVSNKYTTAKNGRYLHNADFSAEGTAKRRKEMREIASAVSKRRKRARYGESVRRGMEGEEECYYDNTLEYFYDKLPDANRTNMIEKVHATIGRYPKWYRPK